MSSKGRSHNKLYVTPREWAEHFGGKRKEGEVVPLRVLPFDHCALSMQPATNPVMTRDGFLFDLKNIIPFLKRHRMHPVTGEPLSAKQLAKVVFHRNKEGEYHCPVTFRTFTPHSHIVAIWPTGNVYSWNAVSEMNVKIKNWRDLLTEEAFTKEDIIHLQDPNAPPREPGQFHHFLHNLKTDAELAEEERRKSDPTYNINADSMAQRVFAQMNESVKEATSLPKPKAQEIQKKKEQEEQEKSGDSLYSNSADWKRWAKPDIKISTSGSFTSSAADLYTKSVEAELTEENRRTLQYAWLKKKKKKGYAELVTNMGSLNLELHCDLTPRTCENFLGLAELHKYDDVIFHRLIKNFMIQGGDPTGTGRGGQSLFGAKFQDEFMQQLHHDERGILSMANSGPNTNASQFFITFAPCPHLDRKHTVFGRVVKGMDVLTRIENLPTDPENDRPLSSIKIERVNVFVNPYRENFLKEQEDKERRDAEADEKWELLHSGEKRMWYSDPSHENRPAASGSGVGKYLRASTTATASSSRAASSLTASQLEAMEGPPTKKPKPQPPRGQFGNFDSW